MPKRAKLPKVQWLADFIAQGSWVPNVADFTKSDPEYWEGNPPAARVYPGGVYIEDWTGRESENCGFRFRFPYFRDEYHSDTLRDLEAHAFDFYKREC